MVLSELWPLHRLYRYRLRGNRVEYRYSRWWWPPRDPGVRMADSLASNSYAVNGNPSVSSMFDTQIGDDMGDDADRFGSPGNPDVSSMFTNAAIANMPYYAVQGNPKGVSG